MKKIPFTLFCLLPFMVMSQNNFVINGNVKSVKPEIEKVYISYASHGENVIDSVDVRNGKYRFDGLISEPTRIDLKAVYNKKLSVTPSMSRDLITVFIEPVSVEVNSLDSFSNATILGSKSNLEFQKLQTAAKPYMKKSGGLLSEIAELKKNGQQSALSVKEKQLEQTQNEMKENVYGRYIRQNPSSPIALFALQQYSGAIIDNPTKVEALFDLLPEKTRMSPDGKRTQILLAFAKRADIGNPAPDFLQGDENGNPVSLKQFKGKYVLINFWASWCGPCRAQNPELIKLYNKYKSDGFEIVGISLDKPGEKDNWLNAIQEDNLTWPQVTDLRFWNNGAARQYGVVALPQNFLIDKSGVIIAKNLKPEQLISKLAELLD